MVIIVHPVRHGEGGNHHATSNLRKRECALLHEAADGLGADAPQLAGGFVEVP